MEVLEQNCFLCNKIYKDIGISFTSREYSDNNDTTKYTSCQMYNIEDIEKKKLLYIINVLDKIEYLCSYCFYHCGICNLKYDNIQNNELPRYLIKYNNENIVSCNNCFIVKYILNFIDTLEKNNSNIGIINENKKIKETMIQQHSIFTNIINKQISVTNNESKNQFDIISKKEIFLTQQINNEFKKINEKLKIISNKYNNTFKKYDDNFKICVTNFNTNKTEIGVFNKLCEENSSKVKIFTSFINNNDDLLNKKDIICQRRLSTYDDKIKIKFTLFDNIMNKYNKEQVNLIKSFNTLTEVNKKNLIEVNEKIIYNKEYFYKIDEKIKLNKNIVNNLEEKYLKIKHNESKNYNYIKKQLQQQIGRGLVQLKYTVIFLAISNIFFIIKELF